MGRSAVLKRVLISAVELITQAQAALADHLGGYLSADQLKALIETVLDVYCYGSPRGRWRMSTRDVLIGYGVPPDVVEKVEADLTNGLLRVIQTGFGVIHPSRQYSYVWFNQRDLLIEEKPRLMEFAEAEEDHSQFDTGYVPERLRRG